MKKGFTFIELMLVIIIMGVLATLIMGNFITSLKKGRDARRKGDLEQIRQALEFYYEDYKSYPPTADVTFGGQLCSPTASGGCTTKIYMQKLPDDPITSKHYKYVIGASNGSFQLYTCLENNLQVLPYVSNPPATFPCNTNCQYPAGTSVACVWGISSSNISP